MFSFPSAGIYESVSGPRFSRTPFPVNIGAKHDADSDYKLGRRLTVDLTD